MSILDVTEDQIFQTLGKGKDPNFKPIEKVRPVIARPKKPSLVNNNIKTGPAVKQAQPVEVPVQHESPASSPQLDNTMRKLTEDMDKLNNRVASLQKMIKWYILPQFVIFLVLVLVIAVKANS